MPALSSWPSSPADVQGSICRPCLYSLALPLTYRNASSPVCIALLLCWRTGNRLACLHSLVLPLTYREERTERVSVHCLLWTSSLLHQMGLALTEVAVAAIVKLYIAVASDGTHAHRSSCSSNSHTAYSYINFSCMQRINDYREYRLRDSTRWVLQVEYVRGWGKVVMERALTWSSSGWDASLLWRPLIINAHMH